MSKASLAIDAAALGLAVYRKDTAATLLARINAHNDAIAARRAAAATDWMWFDFHRFRRYYRKAPARAQLRLPLAMPYDWRPCCGRIVSARYHMAAG